MGSVKAPPRFVFSDQLPSRADSGHANPNKVTPPQGKWIHHSLVVVIA
jgi:hypothetical protein